MSLILGPELFTNGAFTSNVSGWTTIGSGTLTWSSGQASFVRSVNASDRFGQAVSVVSGKYYFVTYDFISGATLTLRMGTTNGNTNRGTHDGVNGLNNGQGFVFVASATESLWLSFGRLTNGTTVLDNLSCRELLGSGNSSFLG